MAKKKSTKAAAKKKTTTKKAKAPKTPKVKKGKSRAERAAKAVEAMGPNHVIDFRLEDSQRPVRAGRHFRLRATMAYEAQEQLELIVKRQRVIYDASQPDLFPVTGDYFEIDTSPIVVRTGASVGISGPIQVMEEPDPGPDYPEFVFPETILFTIIHMNRAVAGCAATIFKAEARTAKP